MCFLAQFPKNIENFLMKVFNESHLNLFNDVPKLKFLGKMCVCSLFEDKKHVEINHL